MKGGGREKERHPKHPLWEQGQKYAAFSEGVAGFGIYPGRENTNTDFLSY